MTRRWLMLTAAMLVAWEAQAYRPNGWEWHTGAYAWSNTELTWHYLDAGSTMWACDMGGAGWGQVGVDRLTTGWVYYMWPWAYSIDTGTWHFMNETDTKWSLRMSAGFWDLYGVPAGMARIPAGSFSMGDSFAEGASSELPVHVVSVSAFNIDVCEVNKALWDNVFNWATNHGYDLNLWPSAGGKAGDHPVQGVSWDMAVKWCNARSEWEGLTPCYYTDSTKTTVFRTGVQPPTSSDAVLWDCRGYRLPTEAEWEKAARGGAIGNRFAWSGSDEIQHARANYCSTNAFAYDTSPTRGYHPSYATNPWPYTSPCASFPANDMGLYDMCGNVLEWCWDGYDSTYYASSPANDPTGLSGGAYRVIRGGSWSEVADYARVSSRDAVLTTNSGLGLGFRCARR